MQGTGGTHRRATDEGMDHRRDTETQRTTETGLFTTERIENMEKDEANREGRIETARGVLERRRIGGG